MKLVSQAGFGKASGVKERIAELKRNDPMAYAKGVQDRTWYW